jgi:fatty acid desaturase
MAKTSARGLDPTEDKIARPSIRRTRIMPTTTRLTTAMAGAGTSRTGVLLLLLWLWMGWLLCCLVSGFALPQDP